MSTTLTSELARSLQQDVECLAAQAQAETRRREDALRRSAPHGRTSPLIWIGVSLIAAELILLGALSSIRLRQLAVAKPPSRLISQNDCRAAVYKAYRAIDAYIRDNGRPPQALDNLVGTYAPVAPADPYTGKVLRYSTDGKGFKLRCGGAGE